MDSHRGDFAHTRNTIIRAISDRFWDIRAGLVVLVGISGGTLSGSGSEVIPPDYPGGVTVAEVGDAQLTLEPNSNVTIAGIGPDLDDGFVVDMAGRAESGFEIEFNPFMPDRIFFEAFGQLAGGTGTEDTTVEAHTPFDGDIRISFLSDPDEGYRLERSGDGMRWFPVLASLTGTGGPLGFDDIGAMSAGSFLYRIRATR